MKNSANKIEMDLNKRLGTKLGLTNPHQIPKVSKVVISCGIGNFKEDKNAIKSVSDDLTSITGQKPKVNLSKKSVSAFKLRENQPVGLTVTLRGKRMYDFLSKLTNVAMPRIRDFKGLSKKAFDGKGNYCVGLTEHVIMPEIKYDTVSVAFGFQVNIRTTASDNEKAKLLLSELGFPFEKDNIKG
jgi:large subunit ribosomal protein L5